MQDSCGCGYRSPTPPFDQIAPALREALGDERSAATTIVAGLIEPEMKVEIEATAFRG